MRGLLRGISYYEAIAGTAAFTAAYVATVGSGILGPGADGIMRALGGPVAMGASAVLFGLASAGLSACIRKKQGGTLLYFGGMLMAAGMVLSGLTRFEAKVVLTEGQSLTGRSGYLDGSVHSARRSTPPAVSIDMLQVSPRIRSGGRALWGLSANMRYTNRITGKGRDLRAGRFLPAYADGTLFFVSGFGYSPRYRLSDASGKTLEEAYSIMRLFPAGQEDSFRVVSLPHTFYLRYFPDSSVVKAAASAGREGPLFLVRAARNLDLIMSEYVTMGQRVNVEASLFLSVEDILRWAEVTVVKDYGLFVMAAGLVLVLTALGGRLSGRGK